MRMRWPLIATTAAILTALAGAAAAHHSFTATYFEDRTMEIEGKLLQFMFRNPHSFVHVEAPDEKGRCSAGPSNGAAPASSRARA